ncbi:hypothetical protein Mapa_007232 [Marchantia paleacea]|nr:hypothetical protein Mapa_007232 [Marchantia paleacea]
MSKKRRPSLELTKSDRMDQRSSSFVDIYPDEERQYLLKGARALSRKLSYNPAVSSLQRHDQIEYLKESARTRQWGIVGDLLAELLGTEEEDPLKSLLRLNLTEFTDVIRWASEDGEERVVRLLTDRDLVDVNSPTYLSAFHTASEVGQAGVVKQLLKHSRKVHKNSPESFRKFVNSWHLQNTALHCACSKGHVGVVKELLDEPYMAELDLNSRNGDGDTPLHMAITRALETMNLDVVDLLCAKGKQKKLLMNKKNKEGKTPYERLWEVASSTPDEEELHDCAELMKQMFLKQKSVNDRRDDYYRERDFLQNVATSLLVGGTLLVSVTSGGFLQMPKLPSPEDFLEPGSSFFDPDSNLGSRKYWYIRAIDIFRCSNAISFFMSIISIIASIRVMISRRDRLFIEREVRDLERSIRVASIALTLATAVAVVAFVSSGLANIPVAESGWSKVVSQWGMHKYIPLTQSTTLTTSLLGSMFVAPIVVMPLAKDYYFFWSEYRGDMSSFRRLMSLLFATALISTVLLLVCMVVFGMGLL